MSEAASLAPVKAPPLLTRLVTHHGAAWVGVADLDAWKAAEKGDAVLLVAGDAVRFPEGLDVAVVLPELRSTVGKPFRIGVAMPDEEDAVAQRFGAQRRPSLVFLRDGRYVTTVSGMHDWGDFVEHIRQALSMPTGMAPISISAGQGMAGPECH